MSRSRTWREMSRWSSPNSWIEISRCRFIRSSEICQHISTLSFITWHRKELHTSRALPCSVRGSSILYRTGCCSCTSFMPSPIQLRRMTSRSIADFWSRQRRKQTTSTCGGLTRWRTGSWSGSTVSSRPPQPVLGDCHPIPPEHSTSMRNGCWISSKCRRRRWRCWWSRSGSSQARALPAMTSSPPGSADRFIPSMPGWRTCGSTWVLMTRWRHHP